MWSISDHMYSGTHSYTFRWKCSTDGNPDETNGNQASDLVHTGCLQDIHYKLMRSSHIRQICPLLGLIAAAQIEFPPPSTNPLLLPHPPPPAPAPTP